MAIVTETGTGSATAESYISVTAADTYHSDRGNTAWAALTTAVKEQCLRKATEYMLQTYRQNWKGVRMSSTQALDWPRGYVYLEPVITGANQEFPNLVADDIVPTEVQRACAILALTASTETLLPDQTQAIVREKVGPLETEYDRASPQYKRFLAVERLLRPYFATSGSLLQVSRA